MSAVLVQLPKPDKANGLTSQEEARLAPLLGAQGEFEIRPVLSYVPTNQSAFRSLPRPTCTNRTTYPKDPTATVILCVESTDAGGDQTPRATWPMLVLGPASMDRSDLSSATTHSFSGSPLDWVVTLKLTSVGASKFERLTAALACKPSGDPTRQLAIVVDHVVISHPQLGDNVACHVGIDGRFAQISGNFDQAQATALAAMLGNPPLPAVFDKTLVWSEP
jgi:preprotein translocase subunit SecD